MNRFLNRWFASATLAFTLFVTLLLVGCGDSSTTFDVDPDWYRQEGQLIELHAQFSKSGWATSQSSGLSVYVDRYDPDLTMKEYYHDLDIMVNHMMMNKESNNIYFHLSSDELPDAEDLRLSTTMPGGVELNMAPVEPLRPFVTDLSEDTLTVTDSLRISITDFGSFDIVSLMGQFPSNQTLREPGTFVIEAPGDTARIILLATIQNRSILERLAGDTLYTGTIRYVQQQHAILVPGVDD